MKYYIQNWPLYIVWAVKYKRHMCVTVGRSCSWINILKLENWQLKFRTIHFSFVWQIREARPVIKQKSSVSVVSISSADGYIRWKYLARFWIVNRQFITNISKNESQLLTQTFLFFFWLTCWRIGLVYVHKEVCSQLSTISVHQNFVNEIVLASLIILFFSDFYSTQ